MTPELVRAAEMKLYKSGKRTAAKLVHDATHTPTSGLRMHKKLKLSETGAVIPYTYDEGLAFLLDHDLTTEEYVSIRKGALKHNAKLYPAYYPYVLDAKKKCYPANINVSELGCSVPLQDLLNHTSQRICMIPEVVSRLKENYKNFEMISKYGCDGSSDQSLYKQRFQSGVVPSTETRFEHLIFSFKYNFDLYN